MPDASYHKKKRDRFKTTADFLRANSNTNVSLCDANVQDFFYAMVHEAEKYLKEVFDFDSEGHGSREARISNWTVVRSSNPTSRMIRKSKYHQNPHRYRLTLPVFDRRTKNYYLWLRNLRMDLVYGETIIGLRRHANSGHVDTARGIYQNFCKSLAGHIRNLHRNRLI